MGRPDNISKTVRIPADLVEYVEGQEGSNFSQKLVGVLEEYRGGDRLREDRIAYYERVLSERRKSLKDVTDKLYKADDLLRCITDALRDAGSGEQGG